jgi:2Fe-2S ferredoxin
MPRITFVSPGGDRVEVDADAGMTILEIVREHGIDLEGACEGALACATCHVIVDPAWFSKLPPPRQDEVDMLDLGVGVMATSRLGCQVEVTRQLDGLTVTLPAITRNLMAGDQGAD